MMRRGFLQWFSSGTIAACAAPNQVAGTAPAARSAPVPRSRIRGICFDLFTLFDPRSIVATAESVAPGRAAELCEAWRTRQFEYCWLRTAGNRYVDFRAVTDEALVFAAKAKGVPLSPDARERLVAAYSELSPWPDAVAALRTWKAAGLRLAPLANYSPAMLERLISNGGLSDVFDALISTDAAKTFKPDPRAYALGVSTLGLAREEIAFSAFGGWDAAGAKWFGYPSFWVNRLGVSQEELGVAPDGTGPGLRELGAFVETWASAEETP